MGESTGSAMGIGLGFEATAGGREGSLPGDRGGVLPAPSSETTSPFAWGSGNGLSRFNANARAAGNPRVFLFIDLAVVDLADMLFFRNILSFFLGGTDAATPSCACLYLVRSIGSRQNESERADGGVGGVAARSTLLLDDPISISRTLDEMMGGEGGGEWRCRYRLP